MNAIENLQHLVQRGFHVSPVHNGSGELEALLYSRFWRSGPVDVLILYSHDEAFAYRATEIDPATRLAPRPGATQWHREGHPDFVTAALLELPPVDDHGPLSSPRWN